MFVADPFVIEYGSKILFSQNPERVFAPQISGAFLWCQRSRYPAATQNLVPLVEHHRLSRCYRLLEFVKNNFAPLFSKQSDSARYRLMAVTDLTGCFEFL